MAGIHMYLHRDALASCNCWSCCRTVPFLVCSCIEGNQLPRLSLGILCLLGPVVLGEGALETGDEAAQLLLLMEVASLRLLGCFLQLLLLQPWDHGLEFCSFGSKAGYLLLQLFQLQNVPHDFSVLLGATLFQHGQLVFQERNLSLENLYYLFQELLLLKAACSLFFHCPCACARAVTV